MSYQSNSLFRKNKGGKINEEGRSDLFVLSTCLECWMHQLQNSCRPQLSRSSMMYWAESNNVSNRHGDLLAVIRYPGSRIDLSSSQPGTDWSARDADPSKLGKIFLSIYYFLIGFQLISKNYFKGKRTLDATETIV